MMSKNYFSAAIALVFLSLLFTRVNAQITPEIYSWKINTTGATGYNSIPSNVQQVQYSANNVYVSASCIPDYTIGPWPGNPNTPSNKNFVFKFTRNPVANTGTAVTVGLGHTGVWSNGVSIFNAKDGMSYNNAGVWNQDALFYEGSSFDNCLGHPAPNGEYHHHVNPTCLYNDADSLNHSPIIGYAFDGFPVYGAYGYTNVNGSGPIKRMQSSYVLNTGTTRINGPAVSAQYPLGAYVEDYTFVQGAGDLDIHNGRFCVTPEYPAGIYAYFVTINSNLDPVYPYTLGTTYYGTVQTGNTGPNGGHVTITETVTTYNPSPSGINTVEDISFEAYPNPASDQLTIFVAPGEDNNLVAYLLNAAGQLISGQANIQPAVPYTFNLEKYQPGIYLLKLESTKRIAVRKVVITK